MTGFYIRQTPTGYYEARYITLSQDDYIVGSYPTHSLAELAKSDAEAILVDNGPPYEMCQTYKAFEDTIVRNIKAARGY